jgi:hypothetical protein
MYSQQRNLDETCFDLDGLIWTVYETESTISSDTSNACVHALSFVGYFG